ncbi:MAG: hypothetical protein QXK06_04205 [Candidatus Diapherotrites archaeon]
MSEPIQKVLLVDYDGPLAKNLKLDSAAFERLACLAIEGFKIAVITGRTPAYMKEFMQAAEKSGIAGKIALFCEHGCIECSFSRGKWIQKVLNTSFPHWKKERATIKEALNNTVLPQGFQGERSITIASLFFNSSDPSKVRQLQQTVALKVKEINLSGKTKTRLIAIPSRHGIEVLPEKATKSHAAERFLERIESPCAGFAFGDLFSDRLMARDPRIKFVPTRNPKQFLEKTENLAKKLQASAIERQRKMSRARLAQTQSLKKKAKKWTGKPGKPIQKRRL